MSLPPDARLARWTAPLAASSAEPRAHPSFEAIREETTKLDAAALAGPDWELVVRHGDEFLSSVGRDLLVGAALAAGLAHREGVAGATLGARVLSALLADATTLPPRPRARANALALFLSRAELALESSKDRSRAGLEVLRGAVDELEVAAATLGAEAPSLRVLREQTARILASLPAPAAEPPPPPLPTSAPVFVMPPPAPAPVPGVLEALPDRAEQVPAFLRRTSGTLLGAAALLRAASSTDAEALRLGLVALYLPVSQVPEATQGARTALAAPPKLVLESVAKAAATAPALQAVREALSAIEKHRFALDFHVHLARALGRAEAREAAALHRREIDALLARLPTLAERQFSDGTPFASSEARAWLEPASRSLDPAASVPVDDPWDEVRALAREGRAADALARGAALAETGPSARDRFALRTRLAALAEELLALPLAAELYAALADDAARRGLDEWDPALVAPVLVGLLRIAPAGDATRGPAFARLARVSPSAALAVCTRSHATPAKPGR